MTFNCREKGREAVAVAAGRKRAGWRTAVGGCGSREGPVAEPAAGEAGEGPSASCGRKSGGLSAGMNRRSWFAKLETEAASGRSGGGLWTQGRQPAVAAGSWEEPGLREAEEAQASGCSSSLTCGRGCCGLEKELLLDDITVPWGKMIIGSIMFITKSGQASAMTLNCREKGREAVAVAAGRKRAGWRTAVGGCGSREGPVAEPTTGEAGEGPSASCGRKSGGLSAGMNRWSWFAKLETEAASGRSGGGLWTQGRQPAVAAGSWEEPGLREAEEAQASGCSGSLTCGRGCCGLEQECEATGGPGPSRLSQVDRLQSTSLQVTGGDSTRATSVPAELREEILGLVRTALGMRAESATPAVPVVAAPALGDDAPLRRPGKEPAERGEREFQGRVLFPGSAAEYHFGETGGREFPSRPAEGGSPFSEFVSSAPVPEGFREPEMTYYSGKGDPIHHIQWFEDMVSIRQMSDGFKCRLFAITLREKAREWFHQLPTGSIYCFEDLRRGFMLRFTTSKKRKKEVESLFRVKQRVGETLGSYLDRFQEELSQVQEMPGHTMMVAFTLGLQSGFFAMELKRSPPVSFEALLERAAREADMEAAHPEFARRLARWAVEEERPRGGRGQEERRVEPRQREQPPPPQHQQQPRQGRQEPNFRLGWRPEWQEPGARRGFRGGDYRQGGQGQFYPPGGMQGQRPALPDQEQAMAIALGERRRAARRRRRDVRVELPYCDFHQEEGHATATCPEFLEMRDRREQQQQQRPEVRIEEIRPRAEEGRCEDRVDVGSRGRIGAIHGGAGIEASRKTSLHTMYRRSVGSTSQSPPPDEKITFSREDMPGHEDPFCDALVIQTAIEDFTVPRILVDNGSSVNVIFKKAFDAMKSRNCKFVIVDAPSSYSAIFGRPLISAFRCVPSSFHQCLKFNVEGVQVRVRGDPKEARECYVTAVNSISWLEGAEEMGRRLKEAEPEAAGDEMEVEESRAQGRVAEEIQEPAEAMAVTEAEEVLAFDEGEAEEWEAQSRLEAAEEVAEMEVLTTGGRVERIRISGGLTPEAQGRMLECVQKNVDIFAWSAAEMPGIDSNIACHRLNLDPEAPPIRQKKRPVADKLAEPIREEVAKLLKAGFVSEIQYPGWVSNVVMRMMDRVFQSQKGRNLEVYVDDLMVKSPDLDSHLRDLEETFATLRGCKMRLNPLKCTFGSGRGKFLGHLLTPAGVEPNPDKVKAILELESPRNAKEVQRLTGRLAGLSRFLSRAGEKCSPIFKSLRGGQKFEWTSECEEAFRALKKQLTQAPLLQGPKEGEDLFLYLGAGAEALSSVLVREEGKRQLPVYYVSRVLRKAELRYPILEKLAFALIISARRFRPYFQAHSIRVVTDHPLRNIFEGVEHSGRLAKWSVELSEFDISFVPRLSIKAQAMADFLADYVVEVAEEELTRPVPWKVMVDGASGRHSLGAGVILESPQGVRIEQTVVVHFPITNNQAEYEAVIAGLRLARELGVHDVEVLTDSLVVASQINGEFEARDPTLQRYLAKVKGVVGTFQTFSIRHVPREDNEQVDQLAKHGPRAGGTITDLFRPSIEEGELMEVEQHPSWMDPFVTFLTTGEYPTGMDGRKLKYKSAYYLMRDGQLYRKTLSGMLARCVGEREVPKILEEVHSGECGSHSGSRTLEGRIVRQGYFWPTLGLDAAKFTKECHKCQLFAPLQLQPAQRLRSITAPWPFAIWGMDLVGPFPQASGQRRFLLVMIDYFSKWLEVKALAKVTSQVVRNFVWGEIICRHGLPQAIVTDNGPQFASAEFTSFCEQLGIDLSDRETPFKLSHGCEAVLPVEFEVRTPRVVGAGEHEEEWRANNEEELRLSLDMVEELRDLAAVRQEEIKRRMAKYFDKHVRVKQFAEGDLVLRKVDAAGRSAAVGKLHPNWEGPFIVQEALKSGGYRLRNVEGETLNPEQIPLPGSHQAGRAGCHSEESASDPEQIPLPGSHQAGRAGCHSEESASDPEQIPLPGSHQAGRAGCHSEESASDPEQIPLPGSHQAGRAGCHSEESASDPEQIPLPGSHQAGRAGCHSEESASDPEQIPLPGSHQAGRAGCHSEESASDPEQIPLPGSHQAGRAGCHSGESASDPEQIPLPGSHQAGRAGCHSEESASDPEQIPLPGSHQAGRAGCHSEESASDPEQIPLPGPHQAGRAGCQSEESASDPEQIPLPGSHQAGRAGCHSEESASDPEQIPLLGSHQAGRAGCHSEESASDPEQIPLPGSHQAGRAGCHSEESASDPEQIPLPGSHQAGRAGCHSEESASDPEQIPLPGSHQAGRAGCHSEESASDPEQIPLPGPHQAGRAGCHSEESASDPE
ncbi:hypothetical protein KSP39_PZI008806 [Platanthera zijinensis]|uniref:Uncharacterized protein n=1 Tax=Platanthera zijinensis TaxID=2320716 RepID=A0AAP0BKI4_9ASPA